MKAEDLASKYSKLTDTERCAFVGQLLRKSHAMKARPAQIPGLGHEETWTVHLQRAGRGAGKTFSASGWLGAEVLEKPGFRAACLVPNFSHFGDVCLYGKAGILTRIPDSSLWHHNEQKRLVTFANGSTIKGYSAENVKQMRGPEFHGLWIDEPADLAHSMLCWEIAKPSVRLPQNDGTPARVFLTGTPKPIPLIFHLQELHEKQPDRYTMSVGATADNLANLDPIVVEELYARYEGSRYFQQEILGLLLDEAEGALWNNETIRKCQADVYMDQLPIDEIVLGVDPALSEDKKADETGIIVGFMSGEDCFIAADYSMKASALEWARKLVTISDRHNIRQWLLEDNLAGPLIKDVLQGVLDETSSKIKIKRIHARGTKARRAEPVAALYEAGRVHHLKQKPGVPDLAQLEAQMVTWDPKENKSPDRIDALVHVVDYLMLRGGGGTLHIPKPQSQKGFTPRLR